MSDPEQIIAGVLAERGIPATTSLGGRDDDEKALSALADPEVTDVFWSGPGLPYAVVRRMPEAGGSTP